MIFPIMVPRSRCDAGDAAVLGTRIDATMVVIFFTLPTPLWSAYLRIDATPGQVAGAMRAAFSSVPWALRRRMMASLPVPLTRARR